MTDLLTGELVRLRAPRPSDTAPLEALHTDLATQRLQLPGSPYPAMQGKPKELLEAPVGPHHTHFVIASLEDDEPVGVCGLAGYRLQQPAAWVRIGIVPQRQGSGIGTDALRLLLAYGFDVLGLHRILLSVTATNERAIQLYRSLGFVEEGRVREALFLDGERVDDVNMGLLEDAWRATRSR